MKWFPHSTSYRQSNLFRRVKRELKHEGIVGLYCFHELALSLAFENQFDIIYSVPDWLNQLDMGRKSRDKLLRLFELMQDESLIKVEIIDDSIEVQSWQILELANNYSSSIRKKFPELFAIIEERIEKKENKRTKHRSIRSHTEGMGLDEKENSPPDFQVEVKSFLKEFMADVFPNEDLIIHSPKIDLAVAKIACTIKPEKWESATKMLEFNKHGVLEKMQTIDEFLKWITSGAFIEEPPF